MFSADSDDPAQLLGPYHPTPALYGLEPPEQQLLPSFTAEPRLLQSLKVYCLPCIHFAIADNSLVSPFVFAVLAS